MGRFQGVRCSFVIFSGLSIGFHSPYPTAQYVSGNLCVDCKAFGKKKKFTVRRDTFDAQYKAAVDYLATQQGWVNTPKSLLKLKPKWEEVLSRTNTVEIKKNQKTKNTWYSYARK